MSEITLERIEELRECFERSQYVDPKHPSAKFARAAYDDFEALLSLAERALRIGEPGIAGAKDAGGGASSSNPSASTRPADGNDLGARLLAFARNVERERAARWIMTENTPSWREAFRYDSHPSNLPYLREKVKFYLGRLDQFEDEYADQLSIALKDHNHG